MEEDKLQFLFLRNNAGQPGHAWPICAPMTCTPAHSWISLCWKEFHFVVDPLKTPRYCIQWSTTVTSKKQGRHARNRTTIHALTAQLFSRSTAIHHPLLISNSLLQQKLHLAPNPPYLKYKVIATRSLERASSFLLLLSLPSWRRQGRIGSTLSFFGLEQYFETYFLNARYLEVEEKKVLPLPLRTNRKGNWKLKSTKNGKEKKIIADISLFYVFPLFRWIQRLSFVLRCLPPSFPHSLHHAHLNTACTLGLSFPFLFLKFWRVCGKHSILGPGLPFCSSNLRKQKWEFSDYAN